MDDHCRDIETTAALDAFSLDEEARQLCLQSPAGDPLLPDCYERKPIPRCSGRDRELLRNRFPAER